MSQSLKLSLEKRKDIKSKKPTYVKQDSHKKSKLSSAYRRPRGLQSKVRLNKKGYRTMPTVGYGSPNAVKHLTSSGLIPFVITNISDLESIDSKKECIIISATVGAKKKLDIVKLAIEKQIAIENLKNPAEFVKESEAKFAARTAAKLARSANRKKKDTKASKKKATVEEKVTAEEKKKTEKAENEKILQKKQ